MADTEGPASGRPPQELVLDELREQSRDLDQRLRSLQALSRSLIAGAISAALITFVGWPDNKPIGESFGWLALSILATLVVMAALADFAAAWWQSVDVDDLIARYHATAHMPQSGVLLELAVAMSLSSNLKVNQRVLLRTKRFVAGQVYATFLAGGLLFAVLLGLVDVT